MNSNTEKYEGNTIHSTAVLHPSVKMGTGNYIGAYTVLEEKVELGNDNHIGPHCIIGDVGESIKFFDKERKGVIIGNNNRLTKQITIDSGTEEPTIVHNNTLWLKNAHAGHDCVIEDNAQLRCNAIIGGHVTASEGSRIYLGAIVHPRLVLPKHCIIGMGTIITKSIVLVDKGIYVGNPGRLLRIQE